MGKFSRACLFLVLVLATAGHAVRDDVKVINRYGQVGLWHTHSAKTLKRGGLQANVWGSYTTHEDFIKRVISIDDAGPTEHNSVPDINAGTFNVSVGYGFTDYLDLAVMLPVYLDKMSDIRAAGITSNTPYGGAGDMEVSMKFQYPPYKHNEFFRMAYYGAVTVPMGENNPGRIPKHNYYLMSDTTLYYGNEDGKPEVDMKMLWTWDFREIIDEFPVLFHFNYGLRWNTNPDINHNFLLNAGIDVRPREWFSIFLDYSAEPSFSAIELRERKLAIPGIGEDSVISLGPLNDPMRLSPGITFLVPGGFNFGAGAQISVARSEDEYMLARESGKDSVDEIWMETAVEPKVKFTASIGWNGSVIPQDTDGDGLLDDDDRCPRDPEDFDGFEDQDGCPDYDNDGDGIPDSLDNCPNEVGPRDNDGCPV
ncbi:MAG: thrombospondin type 3 repeat-containing protein, partial [Fibrobacterota bacterium]